MKNYYQILGISNESSTNEIKSAYRSLARQYHPDVSNHKKGNIFLEIKEAYENLIIPAKRRLYNQLLVLTQQDVPPSCPGKNCLEGDDNSLHPAFTEWNVLSQELFDSVNQEESKGSAEQILELSLTREEAHDGCDLIIEVPIYDMCPDCMGTGDKLVYYCNKCGGSGKVKTVQIIETSLPAGIREGKRFTINFLKYRSLPLRIRLIVHTSISRTEFS